MQWQTMGIDFSLLIDVIDSLHIDTVNLGFYEHGTQGTDCQTCFCMFLEVFWIVMGSLYLILPITCLNEMLYTLSGK